jgi:hypothetical protein
MAARPTSPSHSSEDDMNVEVKPSAASAALHSGLEPSEQLRLLQQDMSEAKAQIREVLERLAAKHGIEQRDFAYAIDGYADDMLSDRVYGIERDLEHRCEEDER